MINFFLLTLIVPKTLLWLPNFKHSVLKDPSKSHTIWTIGTIRNIKKSTVFLSLCRISVLAALHAKYIAPAASAHAALALLTQSLSNKCGAWAYFRNGENSLKF